MPRTAPAPSVRAAGAARLLVLAPNLHGSDGIATVTRQTLGCWPEERGLEVWTLLDERREVPDGRSPVAHRFAGRSRRRFAGWGARSALRDQSGRIVLAMHLSLAPVALPLVLRRATLAVFLHGVECWRPLRRAEAAAVRRANLLVANSEHTVRGFKAANPEFAERPVAVCPLGTEAPPADEPRNRDDATPASRFALIVGRMAAEERYKGHDLLIDLWPEVVRRVPDAQLLIAGDGDDRPRLEAKASTLTAAGRVRFLGRVSDEELRRLYRECAFFLMPSRGEGFGLVFLEAMRAGKACVGGVGAAAEVIEDGVTGFVVDPGDSDVLREAVVRLFREPELASRMGRAGADRVAERFTADHFRTRLRALLESTAGRP